MWTTGESEADRYRDWHASVSATELAQRVGDRAAAFARRPADERAQLAVAWTAYRARWGLPAPSTGRDVTRLPEGRLLGRPEPATDDRVLFDYDAWPTILRWLGGRGRPAEITWR
ncbi:hypothetical protein DNL40_07555 [Xylanimonas oleitrophica]|uniref:Uncharacterized protein n=1 Tax=Xylanimonas oleitrophica TaxID=2607479 RepID=A0A2W5WYG6_9MICO|nr:hypothetical protein [Xylanimonas oleitrophica]PZR53366.1 hypothetical protein DNL40_07555 [Xylanimonas oleitrophica]